MLRVIHSIPEYCPDCGSMNLSDGGMFLYQESNTVLCRFCGIFMLLQEDSDDVEEGPEVPASFVSCPHCCTVDEIQISEGKEWCNGCGLDPNRTEVPVEELAPLWKQGSGIRDFLERGIPKSTTGRIYRFVANVCGPHWSFSASCPQAKSNFTTCLQEEIDDANDSDLLHIGGTDVGKSKRGRGAARKQERERIRKEKRTVVLRCASSGWYDKRHHNETIDSQKSRDTGSGS